MDCAELCPTCNEPPTSHCRCSTGESICKNGHFWFKAINGNLVKGTSHSTQVFAEEQVELCSQCGEPPRLYCRCEIEERLCKNRHSWYYNKNGDRIEGSTHEFSSLSK
jgi:hypothetical protein